MLADFLVGGTTENGFLVNDQFKNVVLEAANFSGRFPFLRVPEVDLFVASRGTDPLAVLAESHRQHRALMSSVTGFQIAVCRGINTRRAVAAGGGQMGSVAAPRDGHHPVGVLLNDQLLFAGGDFIDTNRIVRAADRESRAVRTEAQR